MNWITFGMWIVVWLAVSIVGSLMAAQFIWYGMHKGEDDETTS